jgi:hypothetical protein
LKDGGCVTDIEKLRKAIEAANDLSCHEVEVTERKGNIIVGSLRIYYNEAGEIIRVRSTK